MSAYYDKPEKACLSTAALSNVVPREIGIGALDKGHGRDDKMSLSYKNNYVRLSPRDYRENNLEILNCKLQN